MKLADLLVGAVVAAASMAASSQEMLALPSNFGGSNAAMMKMASEVAAVYFASLDTDRDGKVSLKEYMDPITRQFNDADTNHDGYLTQAELTASLAKEMAKSMAEQPVQGNVRPPTDLRAAPIELPVPAPGAFDRPLSGSRLN